MAIPQMADNPMLENLEERFNAIVTRLRALPLSFWRNLLIAFALIWMCLSLASLFWVVFPTPAVQQPPKVAAPLASQSSGAVSVSVDLEALKGQQLFGDASGLADIAPEPVQKDIQDDVAKTRLNLKLSGVLMSSDPQKSTAIIASGSDQKVYQIDEKLSEGNNVKLAKVLPDRVILDNNGRYEALWLFSEVDFKVKASSKPSSRASTRTAGPEKRTIAANRVPKSINEVIRFSVYREEGKMVGYRIRPGRDRELFEELGLKANDIVTSVNGVTVDDPQQIRKNYQALKTATEASLEILRGGEVVSINVSLDTGE